MELASRSPRTQSAPTSCASDSMNVHRPMRRRGPFLADVGFGACFDEPIPLEPAGVVHHDSAGEFRVERFDEEWFDLIDESGPQYRFRALACELDDFEPGCTFHQSPQSHFMRDTVCSRRTEAGRVTIRGRVLIETTGDDRVETEIDDSRLGDVYRRQFGVVLSDDAVAHLLNGSQHS